MPASPRVIGRYALYDEIAAGGMATVYFGRLLGPVGFSRTVAVKRLHPQFAKDPEFVAMFLDEARLAARIRHPNVVPTLDVVATEGELFLVMDYVQGESLARLSRRRGVPPRIAASIMCGVLHGLHAAHEARSEQGEPLDIVHRDVSPQNILVGVDGSARVLDFGVAKAQGRSQTTRDGRIKGKVAYMAPEQIRGTVSRQTDVYAAAVVTWEALVGQRLFTGDDEFATLAKVLAAEIVPPSQAAPDVPKVFDEVVMRGLAAPAQRWATAREMALALEKCAGVASPREVGEWVESTAADALSRRTTTLNGIESISAKLSIDALSLAAQQAGAAPTAEAPAPAQASEAPSPSTGISNISITALPAPAPARSRALYVGGLAVVVVAASVAFVTRARRDSAAPPVAAAAPPEATATANAPPSPPPVTVGEPPKPPTSAAASASAPAPSTAPSTPTAPTPAAAARPARATTAPKPSNAGCNPPYTTDAQGHRHYKMECL